MDSQARSKVGIGMISAALNHKILGLAPSHEAADSAPGNFGDLMQHGPKRLVVWAGGSEATIYGDRAVNWAFRAWHDSIHRALKAPFTVEGERLVAIEQARVIGGTFGEIIVAEVTEQAAYFERCGYFPHDQVSFMHQVLKQKGII